MSLHRCGETGCPYFGQPSTKGCACHQTNEQYLIEQNNAYRAALVDIRDALTNNAAPLQELARVVLELSV